MATDIRINIGAKDAASTTLTKVSLGVRGLTKNLQKMSATASQSLKGMGSSFGRMGGIAAGVGASIAGPLALAVKGFASAGDELHKMSLRTGVSVEGLSELAFAAEQSGTSLSGVEAGIKGMQRALFEASRGSKEITESLAGIGLTSADLAGKLPVDQFTIMADAIGEVKDPSTRAALSMKLFGRSGADLLPMMAEGAGGIKKMRKEAKELGRQMTTEDAIAAAEYTDAMNRLSSTFKGIRNVIGAALAPVLSDMADRITEMTKGIGGFIRENAGLVKGLAAVGVAITVFGGILLTVGGLATAAGLAVSGLGTVIGLVGGVIAAVFSPVGLVIAAVVVSLGLLATAMGIIAFRAGVFGDSWNVAKEMLASFWETAKTTFEGISNALKSGNWAVAAKIGWAGVRVAFFTGLEQISIAFGVMFPKIWAQIQAFLKQFVMATIKAAATVAQALASPASAAIRLGSFLAGDTLEFKGEAGKGIAAYVQGQRKEAELELKLLSDSVKDMSIDVNVGDAAEGAAPGISKALQDMLAKMLDNPLGDSPIFEGATDDMIAKMMKDLADLPPIEIPVMPVVTPGAEEAIKNKLNKDEVPPPPLQASEGRLITRGRASPPLLDSSKPPPKPDPAIGREGAAIAKRPATTDAKLDAILTGNKILTAIQTAADLSAKATAELARRSEKDTVEFEVVA